MISLLKDVSTTSGTWNDAPQFLEDYLFKHAKKSTGFLSINKTLRYSEGIIETNEELAVSGICTLKPSVYQLDNFSSQDVFLSGDGTRKLLITDNPKAQ